MTTTESPHAVELDPGPPGTGPEPASAHLAGAGALGRLFRPVRGRLILCAVLSAAASVAGFAPYLAIAEITRAVLVTPDVAAVSGTVWAWVAVGAAGACLRLLLVSASSRLGHYVDAETLHALRTRIVRRLGSLPMGWFRATGAGRIKKVMTDDLEQMHQLIAHALGEMVGAAVAIGIGVGYLLLVDWRMALVTLGVLVLTAVCFQTAMRSMTTHMNRLIAATGRISAAGVEYADGITVVKTFGTGGRIRSRFAAAVREHTEAMGAWVTETRYSSAATRLFGNEMTVLGVVLAAGIAFVAADALPVADLVPFLVVGVGLPTSIVPAIQGSQGLRMGRMAAGHVEDLLNTPGLPEPARAQIPDGHRIELDRVSFSYGAGTSTDSTSDDSTDALHDITAVCEPGTITAVVGPSGAGKTTLASLLPRFYDVTSGSIRIGGVDVRSMTQTALLSRMSLVFQDVVLLRDTVTENIRIGRPDATDEQVRAAAEAAYIHDVVTALPDGYDTVLTATGGGFSGGERQRLTIARAILSQAPIVILDEATASLDPDSESQVQQALGRLAAGKTVFVIAHRLHTIAAADQILVLDRGRLVESGTHQQLLARGTVYPRMWRAQQNGDDT